MGAWAPHLPPSEGGLGLSLVQFARVSEVLGRSPIGHWLCNCQAPDIGNMELMHTHADAELRARWLVPLMRGEIRSCFAMTEPEHAGSNPVWMSTRAVRDGDSYVIDGHKWFTTGADGAAFTIVMAVTDPDAAPHRRATMILVPLDTPGFSIVQNIMVMGERGGDHRLTREVHFDECAGAGVAPDRWGRAGIRAGTGAAGSGARASLHALDRHLRAGVRPDVPARRPT
ncbi:MAG: acyl-CoA dehydrogenase family protein [Gemmatimonadaceae bacterium]|nr:acyl-CoA dehydrogenase family protein [Gemmatimonadaceae bacterium]